MSQWLAALDFGGTKHTAGIIAGENLAGPGEPGSQSWREHRRMFSPPGADARTDIQIMFTMLHDMLAGDRLSAVGVSFGGPVDAGSGTVRLSHHVPGWENIPLGAMLEQEFGVPARVDNDANVGALGEHCFGAGQGCDSLLYITVSTGVGGGWILDRRIWHGAGGMAGEIGHTVVDPQGPRCLCGKQGCLERLASGPYMAEDARQRLNLETEQGQVLRDLVNGSLAEITARDLSQAAAQGDELAWQVLERGAWALGTAIGNAANLINPQVFVLGGGVTKSGERYWETIRRVARQTALPEIQVEVLPAALGDDAPLWGAAALAQQALSRSHG